MTVDSENVKVQQSGDGVTITFPTTFKFQSNAHVKVIHRDSAGIETTWTEGTQYDLTGANTGSNGTVTVITTPTDYTPADGETLTTKRDPSLLQESALPLGGPFPSNTVEKMVDLTVQQIQALKEALDRAVKLAETSGAAAPTFPDASPDKFVGWNAAGDDLENKDNTAINTVDVTTLAAGSNATASLSGDTLSLGIPRGDTGATGTMTALVDDTTPQLGGDLDLNGKNLDFPSTPNISDVLDEDAMGSDSATALATQQSIKAYADSLTAFPATTKMLFAQAAAPTGWTKDTTAGLDEAGIRLMTTGTFGTYTAGDNYSTTFGSSKATDASTISTATMPSHTHAWGPYTDSGGSSASVSNAGDDNNGTKDITTTATGGGGSHTHTIALDLNRQDVIMAAKD